jgi:hypothetical protein
MLKNSKCLEKNGQIAANIPRSWSSNTISQWKYQGFLEKRKIPREQKIKHLAIPDWKDTVKGYWGSAQKIQEPTWRASTAKGGAT